MNACLSLVDLSIELPKEEARALWQIERVPTIKGLDHASQILL